MTGAGRLAARATRRAGAGMATLLAPAPALPIYAADQPGLLTAPIGELEAYLADRRISAVLIGPGAGRGAATRRHVLQVLKSGKPTVLDADALTVFAEAPGELMDAIQGPVLLTPHDGEFARLFAVEGPKLARTQAAAKTAGATVLLKGYDTVVADPGGRVAINANAPATLATAGAGDVLSGIALALLGQGMAPFRGGGRGGLAPWRGCRPAWHRPHRRGPAGGPAGRAAGALRELIALRLAEPRRPRCLRRDLSDRRPHRLSLAARRCHTPRAIRGRHPGGGALGRRDGRNHRRLRLDLSAGTLHPQPLCPSGPAPPGHRPGPSGPGLAPLRRAGRAQMPGGQSRGLRLLYAPRLAAGRLGLVDGRALDPLPQMKRAFSPCA